MVAQHAGISILELPRRKASTGGQLTSAARSFNYLLPPLNSLPRSRHHDCVGATSRGVCRRPGPLSIADGAPHARPHLLQPATPRPPASTRTGTLEGQTPVRPDGTVDAAEPARLDGRRFGGVLFPPASRSAVHRGRQSPISWCCWRYATLRWCCGPTARRWRCGSIRRQDRRAHPPTLETATERTGPAGPARGPASSGRCAVNPLDAGPALATLGAGRALPCPTTVTHPKYPRIVLNLGSSPLGVKRQESSSGSLSRCLRLA